MVESFDGCNGKLQSVRKMRARGSFKKRHRLQQSACRRPAVGHAKKKDSELAGLAWVLRALQEGRAYSVLPGLAKHARLMCVPLDEQDVA